MQIRWTAVVAAASVALSSPVGAQVTRADYERAQGLRTRYDGLAIDVPESPRWVGKSHRFHYRKSVRGGHEFVLVDAETLQKRPAFDHQRLASSLSTAASASYTPLTLPFSDFTFEGDESRIEFVIDGEGWRCSLSDYSCSKRENGRPRMTGLRGINGPVRPAGGREDAAPKRSPDGKWEALIVNYNVALRPTDRKGDDEALQFLSRDGSEGEYYELASLVWSPDSTKLAAYRIRPGYRREVRYVESAPEDQLQPKSHTIQYAKPGDVLDLEQPVLFHIDPARKIPVENKLFPNPYELSTAVWRKDSRAFTFEYNQRGHQAYRIIEVDGTTGRARAVISEEPTTFFYYNLANHSRSSGKRFRHDLDDGREIVWMSERDGWNHLYLFDGTTGAVKHQITKGAWAVRSVHKVDEDSRQIWFSAGGMYPGKDPYLLHHYRINFDGSGLVTLTTADADHEVTFSDDMQFFVDTYSRVDQAPVSELRRAADGSVITTLERADITELVKAGWTKPEVFTAKGRDGTTDIWGVIVRPSTLDPKRRYPVIESIYAGPHGSHVPKSFAAFSPMHAQAELGFVVVQIDGMGTSNRSKAFHDVAWQNLGDAGFPDRILWHKAVAVRYPYYDVSRVGIFGGSAGGQNAMGALLFHPDFYKAAVSYAGCHDNRMDKIWWNEQWMGWPIGPHYSASSNVENAPKLQGQLLLVVGELDTNVDPSSTMQVVGALIEANKAFDLLVIPGAGHSAGRRDEHADYGERKRFDFFVQHLLGQMPPVWNAVPVTEDRETRK